MTSWWGRFKDWIIKWWKVLLGFFVSIVSFVIAWRLSRTKVVVSPPLPRPSPTQIEQDKQIVIEVKKLDEQKDKIEDDLKDAHVKRVNDKANELNDISPQVISKPEELPKHLKDIGQQVRNQK